MAAFELSSFLKQQGLRDTKQRTLVTEALQALGKPVSPYTIQKWLAKKKHSVNPVTIYRIIALLEQHALAHKHPSSGLYSLCSMPGTPGHHGYLHCSGCGKTEEFAEPKLCKLENAIAKSAGFRPLSHLCEITGLCPSCA